jgi:prepilin-type N-terminal cleavage/methylation domain-containing protein
MKGRRGFTFMELLIVMVVIGLLSVLAVLRYVDLRNHAVASGVVSDLNSVRLAAYNHWADHESFPADAGAGATPSDLEPYLRTGFDFTRPLYMFDWENAGNGGGMRVGVVVTSPSNSLMSILARRSANGQPYFVVGNTLTYVIVGPDGSL